MNKMEREENLIAAFSFFDKDASGYITIDELQQACKDFGLGDVHLDDMIKEIDQDNVSLLLMFFSCPFAIYVSTTITAVNCNTTVTTSSSTILFLSSL